LLGLDGGFEFGVMIFATEAAADGLIRVPGRHGHRLGADHNQELLAG
jgi:hypothetical protein